MPATRTPAKRQGAEERTPRVHEEPPASPSAQASASAPTSTITARPTRSARAAAAAAAAAATAEAAAARMNPVSTGKPTTVAVERTATEPVPPTATDRTIAAAATAAATREGRPHAPSVRSERSTMSVAARIRQAELRAEEQLAEIRRHELQLQADLVRKKLAADIATLREETDQESNGVQETTDVEVRINDWLERANVRGERAERRPVQLRAHFEQDPLTSRNCVAEETQRARSPTPTRTGDRGVDRLADTLERMARRRVPPRQTQDLPIFSGAAGEWLPFKAAMRDSTELHGFSSAENLARLRTCLRGEARESVTALLYTATEPEVIMRTLEQCYGRPEIIIDKTLSDIRKLPRPGAGAGELNTFAIKLQNVVSVLSCVDNKGYLHNPMLARQVTEKLSPHLRARWCDYAEEHDGRSDAEIVLLSRFLMREADRAVRYAYTAAAVTSPATASKTTPPTRHGGAKKSAAVYVATDAKTTDAKATDAKAKRDQAKKACLCCGGEHAAPQCKRVEAMTVPQRWAWVKETGTCFKCMDSRHRRLDCKAKKCGKGECRQAHHALLHVEPQGPDRIDGSRDEEAVVTAVANDASQGDMVLLKVCPVVVRGPHGLEVHTHALLDEGSTITLVDEGLATAVGAHGPKRPLRIHGVTTAQHEPDSRRVEIKIRGSRTDYHTIEARTVKNLDITSQTITADLLKHGHLEGLELRDVCYEDANPRILIGADNWHLIVSRRLLAGHKNQPAASLTRLGWVVHGMRPRTTNTIVECEDDGTVLHIGSNKCRERPESERLDELITSHFAIDALGISQRIKPVKEDERAIEMFERSVRRIDGHYEVGLPWRTNEPCLPPSYDMAVKRLRTMERKMDKSVEFKKAYTAQMDNMFDKGYAAPVESDDNDPSPPNEWYLPHFAVTNPNKPGKIRLVFDAAARASGRCLNDELLTGPDMLRTLHGVLFRFRERPVAVTADIREMFLRIRIRPEDRVAQRFVWRGDDRRQPPRKYEMRSMIFGARSSPFLAHSVRNKNAEECATTHPLALISITRNHYMDDWLESFVDERSACETINQVRHVHARASFELAGWCTNKPELLEGTEREACGDSPRELGAGALPYEKILGLVWMSGTDELAFNTNMSRVPEEVRARTRTPTKREMLSAVMSIFDPLGIVSPYTITAKIALQELWRKKTGWDEPLPIEEGIVFDEWLGDLASVAALRVPRCYAREVVDERTLHVFTDASGQAYAAVAYWRVTNSEGKVELALVAGKAKVSPLKAQSIPRMELQACLMGARLAAAITEEHTWAGDVVYWSDSRTALHWIRNDSAKYTPFVAHRLGELAERTRAEQWRWVPTAHNVADDATRPGSTRMKQNARWIRGPDFLRAPEEDWPAETNPHDADEESEQVIVVHTDERKSLIDIARFSKYERLLRAIAHVHLFTDKCRKRARELGAAHIKRAEETLIRQAQGESFPAEIQRLERGQGVDRTSRLYRLDPKFDSNGDRLLRLNGRINAATVPVSMKEPPILDGGHELARLLIKYEHQNRNHGGREMIVNNLRQRYWILRVRPNVRKVLWNCTWCKARRGRPNTPVKGDLPAERISAFTRPFSRCGVDCFGPMWVTIGRRREKRWGMLFTCLVVRAVHIELLSSLSTDSAIMAMRRMAARRGWPEVIISDNGTNFRGADTELQEAYAAWLPQLREYAVMKRTEWRFTDPGAPNQGGAWERLIKSVKLSLAVTLNERAPKEEALRTLMAEVENTLNGRPLTHVPVTADDPEALTPNHFLLGTPTGAPYVGECDVADRQQWRAAQALADIFWRRWVSEYLPTLNPRGDHRGKQENLRRGDVVVIADGLLPRNIWPKGRVEEVYTGPDGVVRSADVRTRGGIFRRPVRRLVVLPGREEAAQATPGGDC